MGGGGKRASLEMISLEEAAGADLAGGPGRARAQAGGFMEFCVQGDYPKIGLNPGSLRGNEPTAGLKSTLVKKWNPVCVCVCAAQEALSGQFEGQ